MLQIDGACGIHTADTRGNSISVDGMVGFKEDVEEKVKTSVVSDHHNIADRYAFIDVLRWKGIVRLRNP